MLAGALPMVFPTISIHESFSHPTSMFLRNLMSMDTEEMIRAQPMDSVVLIGGCDKTLPAQLMAAASADRPAVVLPVGPMLVGHFKGEVWAPAPTVGGCGANIAPAPFPKPTSKRSASGWRRPRAPAW